MGVSPLVFSEQTVDNPQNMLLSVVLPGEAETFLAEAKAAAEIAKANKRVIETPTHSGAGLEQDEAADSDEAEPTENGTADSEESSSGEAFGEGSRNEQSSGKSAPVRRRRRSSKSDDTEETVKTSPILKSADESTEESSSEAQAEDTPTDDEAEKEEKSVKVVRRRRRRSSASE